VRLLKHVASFFDLHWSTVKAIDKHGLAAALNPPEFSCVEGLTMDEFALRKGHHYATGAVDPGLRRVLWVGKGRGREDIRPFFDLLGTRWMLSHQGRGGGHERRLRSGGGSQLFPCWGRL